MKKKAGMGAGIIAILLIALALAPKKAAPPPPPTPPPIEPPEPVPPPPGPVPPPPEPIPPPPEPIPPEPPPEPLPPIIPMDQWYFDLDIEGVLGWTLPEYLAGWEIFYKAMYVDYTLWVDELTWEQDYAYYDMRSPDLSKYRVAVHRKIRELGGWYTHEITDGKSMRFMLPPDWTGTQAQFFELVESELAKEGILRP